jgi:polysaccharide export outer membrane protein
MRIFAVVLGLCLLAGCSGGPDLPYCADTPAQAEGIEGYRLGAGDQLRVTVFRHLELSGEFRLDGGGFLALPLGGQFAAMGLTTRQLEDRIEQRLKEDGYLVDPQVSIEVMTYRPFYVLGEVATPGQYEYQNDMSVLNAVAMGGGFTYRADQDDIVIRRGDCRVPAEPDTKILPGDVVTIQERFF